MIRQLRSRDLLSTPLWIHTFILIALAAAQLLMILFAGLVLREALKGTPALDGLTLSSLLLVCSEVVGLVAVYQDWRFGRPFNRNPIFLGSLVLNVAAVASLNLFSR